MRAAPSTCSRFHLIYGAHRAPSCSRRRLAPVHRWTSSPMTTRLSEDKKPGVLPPSRFLNPHPRVFASAEQQIPSPSSLHSSPPAPAHLSPAPNSPACPLPQGATTEGAHPRACGPLHACHRSTDSCRGIAGSASSGTESCRSIAPSAWLAPPPLWPSVPDTSPSG